MSPKPANCIFKKSKYFTVCKLHTDTKKKKKRKGKKKVNNPPYKLISSLLSQVTYGVTKI